MILKLHKPILVNRFLVSLLGVALMTAAPLIRAERSYMGTWSGIYPASSSDSNAQCALCHNSTTGSGYNSYGIDIALSSAGGISARIVDVEDENSDSDPTASDNITEINANAQPGWTGTAPFGVTGDLDPTSNLLPVADANGPYTGTEGQQVQFDGSASYDPDGTITAWNWTFGDGNVGAGENPVHTYATDGVYDVSLVVKDNDNVLSAPSVTTASIEPAGLGLLDAIGAYRPSGKRFYLDVDGNFIWNPPVDVSAAFGAVGDKPIIGDWNGDGVDDIGVYRPSGRRFYLDLDGDDAWNPAIDVSVAFGAIGDEPIIGDWNGDGADDIGVYRPSGRRFYLDSDGNFLWNPALDTTVAFGAIGDMPIIGDWNGDGVDDIGVYRPSIKRFYMDTDGNLAWNPALDTTAAFGGVGDTPIIGDWNGDGVDEIGVYRPPFREFFVDADGNFIWNPSVDVVAAFGAVGDQPIIGKW